MAKSNRKNPGKITTKQAFLRLKKGKGSVLFLVVAIMSVMVILASAVYYSVTAARKQVEVKYDSQQAYQSALALNEIVVDFINIKNDDAFVQSIIGLNTDETLTTSNGDGAGFSELAGGLGDYKVTVKKIKGDSTDAVHILEIQTHINVNGEESLITTVGEFQVKTKPYNFDRFFTSTGYAPNDVIFANMKNDESGSQIFLDNEFTVFGGQQGDLTIRSPIVSAGSLRFESPAMLQEGTKLTVGNNLYLFSANGHSTTQEFLVGGNFTLYESYCTTPSNEMNIIGDFYCSKGLGGNVYVNGDMIYKGGANGKVYVNGDLFIPSGSNPNLNNFTIGGNIYYYDQNNRNGYDGRCNGDVYNMYTADHKNSENMKFDLSNVTSAESDEAIRRKMDAIQNEAGSTNGGYSDVWPADRGVKYSVSGVKRQIDEAIGKPEYINWDLEEKFTNVDDTNKLSINFESNKTLTIPATSKNTYYTIESINKITGASGIVFDTFMGNANSKLELDDKKNYGNIYVYLKPNCYLEGTTIKTDNPSKFDCFSWGAAGGTRFITACGMGSVVFVVPDNCTYLQSEHGFTGHLAMYEKLNGANVSYSVDAAGKRTFGWFGRSDCVAGGEVKTRSKNNILEANGLIKNSVLSEYTATSPNNKPYYIHNNVFMVTVEKNADMDFSAGRNILSGYIYAPYMTFDADGIFGNTESAMVGGIIVSDIKQASANDYYICATPYDYYDRYVNENDSPEKQEETRSKYMEKLMNESGCNTILSSSTSRSWRKYGYN